MRCHLAARRAAVALWLLGGLGTITAACRSGERAPPPQEPGLDGLAAHVSAVIRTIADSPDPAGAARRLVTRWKLTAPELVERCTPGYRELYARYAASFDAHVDEVAEQLRARIDATGKRWRVLARVHYADDPYISAAMVRLRWVLPTARPGQVAFVADATPVAGTPDQDGGRGDAAVAAAADAARIDAVFVHTGTRWRALIGFGDAVDQLVRERVGDGCFHRLDLSCRSGRCIYETYRLFHAAVMGGDAAGACAGLSGR